MQNSKTNATPRGIGGRGLVALAASILALSAATEAAETGRKTAGAVAAQAPRLSAKIYKRPLMRSGRIQYCLKHLDRFDGRINGRMTTATARALRRFRDDFEFSGDDVTQQWPLHTALWRQCRDGWVRAGGALDRFGFPVWAATPSVVAATASQTRPPPNNAAAVMEPQPSRPTSNAAGGNGICLSGELREVLARSPGPRPDLPACDQPCLPQPADLDRDDARGYERRLNFSWCKTCVPVQGELGLDDIQRIEKAGNITLCPDPRRLLRARPSTAGSVSLDSLRGTRALFRRDLRAAAPHDGLAVVIGISQLANGTRPRGERDAAGVAALLVERLGFRSSRVIELNNPALAEIEGVLGRSGEARGLVAERLKDGGDLPLFVYVSGAGIIGDDGEPYLLGADAQGSRAKPAGIALASLYQRIARSGAGTATLVLEVDFARDVTAPVVAPNAPARTTAVLPRESHRNLVVITATERDQRPLEDADSGLSLFTRHLIEALSGHADLGPIGNGDGSIDSAEAFVYAASRTSLVARKVSGVLQRPMISQPRVLTLGRLGPPQR